MKVYRVQAGDGRGPWRPGFSHVWIDDDAPSGHLTETVMDLLPVAVLRSLPTTHAYGCGCRSLEQLCEWFTPVERDRLSRLGFSPVVMHVDEVLAESDRQVFFARQRPLTDGVTRLNWPTPTGEKGPR